MINWISNSVRNWLNHLDQSKVSKVIKRGREELNTKRIEYTKKKEELDNKWRYFKVEDKEFKGKIDAHKLLVDEIKKFKEELIKVFCINHLFRAKMILKMRKNF